MRSTDPTVYRTIQGGGPDWGARTANIVAALWPERCKAMVSVSGYLISSQESGKMALPPKAELQPDASSYAKKFSGKYAHQLIKGGIGHNLPQEAPQAFAQAVVDVDGY